MVNGLVTPDPALLEFDPVEHRFYYCGSEIPGVSRILEEAGHVKLDHIPPDVLERAAQIGTEAHRATEIHDLGGKPECDPLVYPAFASYCLYRRKRDLTILEVEKHVLGHHKGFLYAGILDRLWQDGETRYLIDIKTSNEIYHSAYIQVCAYAYAEGSGATPAILKLDKKKGAIAKLHVLTPADIEEHTAEWLRCLESYYYKKKNRVLVERNNKPNGRGFRVRAQGASDHSPATEGESPTY